MSMSESSNQQGFSKEKKEKEQFSIKEWETSEKSLGLEGRDIEYIQNSVNESRNDPIELIPTEEGKYKIRSKSIIGAISTPTGKTIHIRPKFEMENFPWILLYCRGLREIKDYSRRVKIKAGEELVDIIAEIFLSEAEKILGRGLFKTYRQKEETLETLRGRVLFQEQFQKNLCQEYKITCEYDELTQDILENRAILFSAHILRRIVKSSDLKSEINRLALNLRQSGVSLKRVRPENIRENSITRLNDYYSFILEICELILRYVKLETLWEEGKVPISSVLVKTPYLFQDFLSEIVKNKVLDGYEVYSEKEYIDNLVSPLKIGGWEKLGYRKMRPDILVKRDGEVKLVIDAKYKKSQKKSDIYQAVAYSLSREAPTVLVYPEDEGEIKGGYEIAQADGQGVFILTIDLNTHADSLEEFVDQIGEDLGKKLREIFENEL